MVTGIIPNTTYYFAVFEMNGPGCNRTITSPRCSLANATTPAIGTYNWYYGNMHAHSDYSLTATWTTPVTAPAARPLLQHRQTALNFTSPMGILDHNHNEGPR